MNAAGHGSVSGGARGLLTQYLEPVGYDAARGLDNIVLADVCLLSVSIETAGRVFTEPNPCNAVVPTREMESDLLGRCGQPTHST